MTANSGRPGWTRNCVSLPYAGKYRCWTSAARRKAVLLYFFSWTKGQESFFMISGDAIEIGIRETSQTRGGKRELGDFSQYFFGAFSRSVYLLQSSLVGHKSYRSVPFNGRWSGLTGRLLRPKTPKDNLIAAALIPECPFHSYNLACLKTGGWFWTTLTHLLPDVAGQSCWDLEVYPVFCDGGHSFSGMNEILRLFLKRFTGYTFYLTGRETILLFFAPSNSVQREKQIRSDRRGFPLNIFIL